MPYRHKEGLISPKKQRNIAEEATEYRRNSDGSKVMARKSIMHQATKPLTVCYLQSSQQTGPPFAYLQPRIGP